jgi:hypothetical protein
MVIRGEVAKSRSIYKAAAVCAGWVAIAFLFWINLMTWPEEVDVPAFGDLPPNYGSGLVWAAAMLAVAVAVGMMMIPVMREAVRARREGRRRAGVASVAGLVLGTVAWLFGGLWTLAILIASENGCAGQGLSSFECVHQPGLFLKVLGVLTFVSATPVWSVVLVAGARSRVTAWLSPALIIGLYLLALYLWEPHVGLGVPHRPDPSSA